ncbi:hypothetical protein LTR84_005774 [Exophiala bonariae]|uniref:Rhodopsin domain-containing protein n=1 Tax=Exophiala bonariae TaxID=1690606 RepID=A0AAV9N7I7_9EURO|nr:hypothetical protein LTR84_005774 [Exophiala bonariae]
MAALVVMFVKDSFMIVMIKNGLGLQAENLQPSNFEMIGKALFGSMIAYCFGIGLVKLSILVMYHRIFDTRNVRIVVKIVAAANLIWIILFTGLAIFQCTPVHRAWNPSIPGKCLDSKELFVGNAVPNIVIDLFMVAIPIYPVSKLRLPLSQRIALVGLFMLGGVVCVVSIYRVTTISTLDPTNLAYTIRGPAVLGNVEMATAVLSANLPTLRPLFSSFIHTVGPSKGSSTYHASSKARSRSSTLLSDLSRKSKSDGFTVIITENSPRSALKPLPKLPGATTNTRDELGIVPLNAIHVKRDVDIESVSTCLGQPYFDRSGA